VSHVPPAAEAGAGGPDRAVSASPDGGDGLAAAHGDGLAAASGEGLVPAGGGSATAGRDGRAATRGDLLAAGVLAVLALALYLPGLGAEILRHPLEAKYALVAREMLEGGPRLVPHVYGEIFPDKPPLYFWAVAGLGWLGGGRIDEVTARLPAVTAALAAVLLVFALGRALFGARAGLVAGAALATSNLYFWYARQGHLDQFLTAFVTLACLALWRSFGAVTPRAAAGWTALAWSAMALGVLSKGLIGLAVPLFAGGAYLAATGPLRAVPARLGLGLGLPVFLGVVLAWFGPAVAHYGAGYLYEAVVHQHFERYARTWSHAAPWYYYLGEFPVGFVPWVLFLPGALVLGWRARAEDGAAPGRRPILFPLAWFVTGFVFFSLSSGKRGPYLLPIYPAAALLVGWLWDRVLGSGRRSAWIGVPLGGTCGVAALLAGFLLVVPRRLIPGHRIDTLVPADPRWLAATAAMLVIGAALVFLLWRRGRAAATFATLVAVQVTLLLAVATVRATRYELDFPVRAFAARVRAAVPPGEPVYSLFEPYNNIVAFYLDRPVRPLLAPGDLAAVRRAGRPVFVLLGPDEALDGEPARAVTEAAFERRRRLTLVRLEPPAR
jgi:4-amino-4-deoxy-L-arabinose transferase-like glycosyltransferase